MITPNVTTTNVARDNAWVGVQLGQAYGDIRIGAERVEAAAGLTEQLAEFRQQLRRAGQGGVLDEEDYAAAEAELSVVDESLAQSPPDRRSLRTALKKLLGLVSDAPELVARLKAIINLVRGTP